eukprot:TRINITY_DN24086_c0_g1_i1.p1 TRINITY_DN24086_c0_g1~~TRINITY_DN24086_c0_g1_i1.p1  ORF type:complete len:186 (+),score=6.84 TRINITY_DN24086_c0_g1_i1:11-568(+)
MTMNPARSFIFRANSLLRLTPASPSLAVRHVETQASASFSKKTYKKKPHLDWRLGYDDLMRQQFLASGPERLTAKRRTEYGKKAVHNLRKDGMVPGILVGMKQDPVLITLERKRVVQLLESAEGFCPRQYYLDLEGEVFYIQPTNLLRNPVSDEPLQITLKRLPMPTEEAKAEYVPLTGDKAARW